MHVPFDSSPDVVPSSRDWQVVLAKAVLDGYELRLCRKLSPCGVLVHHEARVVLFAPDLFDALLMPHGVETT